MVHRSDRVLVVVQNLPVPLDRRVWLECQALVAEGIGVSVICPKGPGDPSFEVLDGVRIHKYRPAPQGSGGAVGYLVEFTWSWLATAVRSLGIFVRDGFGVLQACNPPDTYALLALLYRPFGVRFVYDQHDLNPEVFLSRFGPPRSRGAQLQLRVLLMLEWVTYRAADHVISTNDSYRRTALERGELSPDGITVVRSGPDTAAMRPVAGSHALRQGHRHLLVYLGIMGPQDGVDLLLQAMARIVHGHRRADVHLALLGFGDCFEELQRQCADLGLEDHVTFAGRADAQMVCEYLSTAALGVCPDPLNPLNDVSTMNKVMEYMAYALPVVGFDLKENRLSVGAAGVLVPPDDVEALAGAVVELLDDGPRRAALSRAARERAVEVLDWELQRRRYVGVHAHLLGLPQLRTAEDPGRDRERRHEADWCGVDRWGHSLVDLRDEAVLAGFLQSRDLVPSQPGPPDRELVLLLDLDGGVDGAEPQAG